ncbi:protein ABHD1-like isoform X1 [Syngnathoides biaculeatus]|uniref:protein ABHD1-like isoform X1 n=1 Tax=Syngnathoides biaculeatus TaxID=300417 RepID=UPI002ADE6E32|nr:protein ABHD1-like isoform X1 [Syngnathoides biaculeatus]
MLWRVHWELGSTADAVLLCSLAAALWCLWGRKSQGPTSSARSPQIPQTKIVVVLKSLVVLNCNRVLPAAPETVAGVQRDVPRLPAGALPRRERELQPDAVVLGGPAPDAALRPHQVQTARRLPQRANPHARRRSDLAGLGGQRRQRRLPGSVHAAHRAGPAGLDGRQPPDVRAPRRQAGRPPRLQTPQTFCAADTSDLEQVVRHVKSLYPQSPLFGAGISLGGMLLLNYLGRKGAESGLVAGWTVSAPWDALKSADSMEEALNRLLFNRHLTRGLCDAVRRHRRVLEKVADIEHVLEARTIREFDERFTAPLFGYESCTEYYRHASPAERLSRTAVPVLCLNAADDPFSPQHAFPLGAAKELPNVALLVTAHGGHIAFLEGLFPRAAGYMERVFGQFARAVLEHPHDARKACGLPGGLNGK